MTMAKAHEVSTKEEASVDDVEEALVHPHARQHSRVHAPACALSHLCSWSIRSPVRIICDNGIEGVAFLSDFEIHKQKKVGASLPYAPRKTMPSGGWESKHSAIFNVMRKVQQ